MSLTIYNTLGREKQLFTAIIPGKVKMYLCGPTVYDLLHIGNFRGVIFFNLVRNWLEALDYQVTFVLNFTDIDDKIINRANEQHTNASELSNRYIEEYKQDYARLHLKPHDMNPKCTNHIHDMIVFIEKLIQKGHAYSIEDGSVFFNIDSKADYGKLSGKKSEDLIAGHRVDSDSRKKNPLDFVLWKPAKDGEPFWESPWGKGRPGWHIECSAMNHAIFGEQIDIHGGGIDLIFPHHENEIAQSESVTGQVFSRYWMHNNFIRFGDEKMSKSLGNVIKARDFMNDYHPEILKFLILSVHYRSELNIDKEQIMQSIARLTRIYKAIKDAKKYNEQTTNHNNKDFEGKISSYKKKIESGLNDDFNTPIVIATIFELVRDFNALTAELKQKNPLLHSAAKQFLEFIAYYGSLLSLFQENPETFLEQLHLILIKEKNINTSQIEDFIHERNQARVNKNYARSDEIRDNLLKLGIHIQDTPSGTNWEVSL
jgi:cysteinyl-tRNA synthetase